MELVAYPFRVIRIPESREHGEEATREAAPTVQQKIRRGILCFISELDGSALPSHWISKRGVISSSAESYPEARNRRGFFRKRSKHKLNGLEVFMVRNAIVTVALSLFCFHGFVAPCVKADEVGKLKAIEELVKDAHEGVKCMDVDELKKRIKENNKLVLLDVRTQKEYEAAHIKGSAWVERGIAEFVLVRTLPVPDAEIVVYCKMGHRAGLVTKALKSAGYTNVVSLEGGLDEWMRKGNTVRNFLGEFKMVNPAEINASTFGVEFYQQKD